MVYAALAYSTIAAGADRDARHERGGGGARRRAGDDLPERAAHEAAAAVHDRRPRPPAADDLPIMQDDRIHWNGQPVALVLAETQEQADHATSLIRVTYEAEPAITSFDAAKAKAPTCPIRSGRAAERSRSATPRRRWPPRRSRSTSTYRTPRHNHNAIELHAATVAWDGDELTVHDATQVVNAHSLDAGADVRARGGAGPRHSRPMSAAASAARACGSTRSWPRRRPGWRGRPVRIVLSREGVFRIVGGRTTTEQRVALGAQAGRHASTR